MSASTSKNYRYITTGFKAIIDLRHLLINASNFVFIENILLRQVTNNNRVIYKPNMSKYSTSEKPACIAIILMVLSFTNNSCSTVHVYQVGGPQGREAGNQPGTEWESKSSNTFLWGGIRQDVRIENCVLGDGSRLNIEEMKVEKNFGRIVATVLTLGIWEPVKISWRCAKPKTTIRD